MPAIERCGHKNGCRHPLSMHSEARKGVPAFCGKCKNVKALHEFTKAVAA